MWLTNVEDGDDRLMFNTAKKASDFIDVSRSTLCHARNTDEALDGWHVTDAKNEPGSAVASSPLANRVIKTQRHKKDDGHVAPSTNLAPLMQCGSSARLDSPWACGT